jgi:SAM-dependent MidA family methyltransferase
MGAPQRLMSLIEKAGADEEKAESLVNSYERLIDPDQMGERYKVLVFVDEAQEVMPPGGFGENEVFTYVKEDEDDEDNPDEAPKK